MFCSNNSQHWYLYVNPSEAELSQNVNWVWYKGNCGGEELYVAGTIFISLYENSVYSVRGQGGCIQNVKV